MEKENPVLVEDPSVRSTLHHRHRRDNALAFLSTVVQTLARCFQENEQAPTSTSTWCYLYPKHAREQHGGGSSPAGPSFFRSSISRRMFMTVADMRALGYHVYEAINMRNLAALEELFDPLVIRAGSNLSLCRMVK
jgi:hypothetical protein